MTTKEEQVWEVEQTEEPEEEERDIISYKISYYPADITLDGYVEKDNKKQLIVPDFQRNYVWTLVQASKLIESFLLGLPVPGVFLYKERDTNKLMIIDGHQRIMSAIKYFREDFEDKKFRLKNVHQKWDGKSFSELAESEQNQLRDTVLRATIIQQMEPGDDSSKYHVFERLNTGGTNLNPMEVRKCVFFGDYFKLLEELNEDKNWRLIIGKPIIDRRLRDTELVLRVLALSSKHLEYQKPMKWFLNNHLAYRNRQDSEERRKYLSETREAFTRSCAEVAVQLGEKPFHLRGRLNYAALDSVMVAVITSQGRCFANLKANYDRLKNDARYIELSTMNTSDDNPLKERMAIAIKYLCG